MLHLHMYFLSKTSLKFHSLILTSFLNHQITFPVERQKKQGKKKEKKVKNDKRQILSCCYSHTTNHLLSNHVIHNLNQKTSLLRCESFLTRYLHELQDSVPQFQDLTTMTRTHSAELDWLDKTLMMTMMVWQVISQLQRHNIPSLNDSRSDDSTISSQLFMSLVS